MKKKWLILVSLMVVVSMLVISSPAMATPPNNVQGEFGWTSTLLDERVSGRNIFLRTFEEGWWTGSFNGYTTAEDGIVVIHGFDDEDPASFHGIISFEGEVLGKTGTLEMLCLAKQADAFSDWEGTWVILSGTGELENLRGRGTLVGPGPVIYSGSVHFEP